MDSDNPINPGRAQPGKILVVEDEPAIRNGLLDVFAHHGYEVEGCENGRRGLDKALTGDYDLVLLDVMLPEMDGFTICDRIRQTDRHQAIILLTARSADDEIIHGLKMGADDYVTKPFSVAQLVLRVQAVLRRASAPATQQEKKPHRLQLANGLLIDVDNLCALEDESLAFTRREMDVLLYLALNAGRPVAREELLCKVWGYAEDSNIETRTVDIHIAKLRRKIEPDAKNPESLLTVRGAGYRLDLAP